VGKILLATVHQHAQVCVRNPERAVRLQVKKDACSAETPRNINSAQQSIRVTSQKSLKTILPLPERSMRENPSSICALL